LDGFPEEGGGAGLRTLLPAAFARPEEIEIMIRRRILSHLMAMTAFAALFLITLACITNVATSAPQPKSDIGNKADAATTLPTDVDPLVRQVKELQKQLADLQARVNQIPAPRIIAAGTATFHLGAVQDNATNARVQLDANVAARLGNDYIVLLTNRFPTGGYPFFVPYWKQATDGFDITLVDVTLGPDSTASYEYNQNKLYLIDWIDVRK